MKKQSIRVISLLISLMLVMTNVVWAMPGEGDTVDKGYYGTDHTGSSNLNLNGENGLSMKIDCIDSFGNTYYQITGTSTKKLSTGNGNYVNMTSKSKSQLVYELDFMLGNNKTGIGVRINTDASSNASFNPIAKWVVGNNDGINIEANKWYRVAVLFTPAEDKFFWNVYLNGEKVLNGEYACTQINYVRVHVCAAQDDNVDLSLDNFRAYTTDNAYTAGEVSNLTSKSGIVNIEGNVISVPYEMNTEALLNDLVGADKICLMVGSKEVTEGPLTKDGNIIAYNATSGRYSYYTLTVQSQSNNSVKYDFDTISPATHIDNGTLSLVNDEERNGQVLEIVSANNGKSTGFAVKNLEFNESYIITYDVKREGNSTVSQSWNGAGNRIISIYGNSVQLFCKNAMFNGTKYGEWTRYAAYVDPVEKKAQLYINGVAVGGEMDLSEIETAITPVMTYPSFRFFVQSTDTKVWVDDFAIYPATADDVAKLTQGAIEVTANEESEVLVVGIPGAMGKISGAAGTDVANIGTILTAGEGVELNVYTAEGALVTEGAIADGMILKASKDGITAIYRFADVNATLISQEKAEGKIKFVLDSYDNNMIIVARYSVNENILLNVEASTTQKGLYTKEITCGNDEKVKVFVWDDAQSMMPLYVFE